MLAKFVGLLVQDRPRLTDIELAIIVGVARERGTQRNGIRSRLPPVNRILVDPP